MTKLRVVLVLATIIIYAMTVLAILNDGLNWPAVAIADLVALNWRSQFNSDFVIYLILGATWISWREGFTLRGHAFGVLSVVMGGMFTFPYLLWATVVAMGDPRSVLLGVHADGEGERRGL